MKMNRKYIAIASLVGVIAIVATYAIGLVELPFLTNTIFDTRTVINGIKVPPMPDPKINNATIAGVDSDNNGVRDDIDRIIAEKFGDNPTRYQAVVQYERSLLAVLMRIGDKQAISVYKLQQDCFSSPMLKELSVVTKMLLNTNERGRAYATALAGTGDGDPCPQDRWVK